MLEFEVCTWHLFLDEANSTVQLYFEQDGDGEDLNAKIELKDDVYVIEVSLS